MGINLTIIARITGFLFMVFSPILLIPAIISIANNDQLQWAFINNLLIQLVIGLIFWLPGRKQHYTLRRREGFLVVVLFWLLISILGASVFVSVLNLSWVDALFESVSGLTTTGATILTGLDNMPASILFYRQSLQWFGGMGLIMLAVAIMPMLGIGGMKMYLAETPGPMKEDKMTPRIVSSAKLLWIIYSVLTLICALAYWFAGMSLFDAITHAMTTLSTGGFSTHDASMGYFDSTLIDYIAIVFMLLGGINFSVHFVVLLRADPTYYWRNTEVRYFLVFVLFMVLFVTLILHLYAHEGSFMNELKDASFEIVSLITSTGFGLADFSHWPLFLPVLMILISFVGGCGGSTAGGIKVMRMALLLKMGWREIRQLIHPRGVFPVKFSGIRISQHIQHNVLGFFAVYTITFVILLLLMMLVSGVDQITAFSAIATSLNNLGPGLGEVTENFVSINDAGKLVAASAMLLGRLEVFSILVLFHPAFWRG